MKCVISDIYCSSKSNHFRRFGYAENLRFTHLCDLMQSPATKLPKGWKWIELPETESTNKYAMDLIHEGLAHHGVCVFTHFQSRGKGRRGKSWITNPGENLTVSVIIYPDQHQQDPVLISFAAAVAAFRLCQAYAGKEVAIKWPNDIYWQNRKLGGILIETILKKGKPVCAVIGTGINVNQTEFSVSGKEPCSLAGITHQQWTPGTLGKELCCLLNETLQLDKSELMRWYNEHLYRKNELVRLQFNGSVGEVIIKEVNAKGELLIQSKEEIMALREAEWL